MYDLNAKADNKLSARLTRWRHGTRDVTSEEPRGADKMWEAIERSRPISVHGQLQWPGCEGGLGARVHSTKANGTVSCLSRQSVFVDPVCVHLARRIGAGPRHGRLIRLLECGEEALARISWWRYQHDSTHRTYQASALLAFVEEQTTFLDMGKMLMASMSCSGSNITRGGEALDGWRMHRCPAVADISV